MTPLRQRMIEDMQLRNLSTGTQRAYLHYITGRARFYQTSPQRLSGLCAIRGTANPPARFSAAVRQGARSATNSLAHGLTSRHTVLLDVDSRAQFQEMLDDFDATYQPTTPAQKKLVDEMAANRRRLDRFWMIETALLEDELRRLSAPIENPQDGDVGMQIARAFRSLADGSQSLALGRRYQSTLSRDFDRAYRALRELQRTAEAKSPSQAIQPPPPPPEPPQPEEVAALPEAATCPAPGLAPSPENRRLRNEPTGLRSPARRRRWLALFHPIDRARRRAA